MNEAPYILGLDISSTNLGYVLYRGTVIDHGEHKLTGDIAERCRRAYNHFYTLLNRYPQVDCLAVEGPASRFKKSLIPQCRVSGAILALASQRNLPFVEVSPTAAKFALAGKGNVDKCTMMARASSYGVIGEHASDALGVALASLKRIEVVA